MVEHMLCTHEVIGSSPFASNTRLIGLSCFYKPFNPTLFFLGGLPGVSNLVLEDVHLKGTNTSAASGQRRQAKRPLPPLPMPPLCASRPPAEAPAEANKRECALSYLAHCDKNTQERDQNHVVPLGESRCVCFSEHRCLSSIPVCGANGCKVST